MLLSLHDSSVSVISCVRSSNIEPAVIVEFRLESIDSDSLRSIQSGAMVTLCLLGRTIPAGGATPGSSRREQIIFFMDLVYIVGGKQSSDWKRYLMVSNR